MRYHGGKWRIAPWIVSHFPEHRTYVEPYGGGASVLLRKRRSFAEVYNDIDGEVVNLFRVLRHPEKSLLLLGAVALTPFAREEFESSLEGDPDPVELARRLLVRSQMGYGSDAACGRVTGFRANIRRRGSVPAHDWARLPGALAEVVERLRGVVVEARPALQILTTHDSPQTLHYVDPPYLGDARSDRRRGHRSYRHDMAGETEHRELAALLRSLAGAVVVSGYAHPLYEEIYSGWHRVEKATHADGARKAVEVLWMNFEPTVNRELFA